MHVPKALRAQTPVEPGFTLRNIGPNVWAAIDNPKAKQRSFVNAGFVIGDDGVVVIDTLTHDDHARHLLQEIRKLTQLPVRFVVNTHYHGDHVAGNKVFADIGARVLAHRNVRRWIHGHTGGDSVVIVPDAKAVFAGDLLWRNMTPNTIDGSTKAWMQTLDSLAGTYAGHTFVPGHGELSTAQDVAAFRDYFAELQKLVADARASGKSGDAVTQAVMPALTPKYGTWELFSYLGPLNIVQAEAELNGNKRIPQP